MAKKFQLSKSFFTGSSPGSHRLSKVTKGKGIVGSLDLFSEWDMILDDMGPKDFRANWVWPSRLAKARVAVKARFYELFDLEYEPWEEGRGNWDHSDSEDVDDEVRELPNQCCGGSSASTNFHFGESSRSIDTVNVSKVDRIGCLGVVSKDPMVSSSCAATEFKVVCVEVLEVDNPLAGELDFSSPSRMEVVEEIPSSPISYVTVSPIPNHH
ncbi:hypothetical protein RHMOL_Rhmol09G0121900 [Rhododendron molle]|uniref:Uncharacterized protein n=1 Tax=Rhododendron molle TaxID=49168 RepID=A0ACC0ME65_RHOML|nr:hypothetical protein RHMOL_Rhmol09G0121900 [Rhododendron molle]